MNWKENNEKQNALGGPEASNGRPESDLSWSHYPDQPTLLTIADDFAYPQSWLWQVQTIGNAIAGVTIADY